MSSNNSSPSNSPTNTPTPTPTFSPAPTLTPAFIASNSTNDSSLDTSEEKTDVSPTIVEKQEVLGAKTENKNKFVAAWVFAGLGLLFIFIYLAKAGIIKKIKK